MLGCVRPLLRCVGTKAVSRPVLLMRPRRHTSSPDSSAPQNAGSSYDTFFSIIRETPPPAAYTLAAEDIAAVRESMAPPPAAAQDAEPRVVEPILPWALEDGGSCPQEPSSPHASSPAPQSQPTPRRYVGNHDNRNGAGGGGRHGAGSNSQAKFSGKPGKLYPKAHPGNHQGGGGGNGGGQPKAGSRVTAHGNSPAAGGHPHGSSQHVGGYLAEGGNARSRTKPGARKNPAPPQNAVNPKQVGLPKSTEVNLRTSVGEPLPVSADGTLDTVVDLPLKKALEKRSAGTPADLTAALAETRKAILRVAGLGGPRGRLNVSEDMMKSLEKATLVLEEEMKEAEKEIQ